MSNQTFTPGKISRRAFSASLARVIGALTVTGTAAGGVAAGQTEPPVAIKADHPLFPAVADWKAKLAAKKRAFAAWHENRHLNYVDFDNNPYRNAMIEADAVELEAWQRVREILVDL